MKLKTADKKLPHRFARDGNFWRERRFDRTKCYPRFTIWRGRILERRMSWTIETKTLKADCGLSIRRDYTIPRPTAIRTSRSFRRVCGSYFLCGSGRREQRRGTFGRFRHAIQTGSRQCRYRVKSSEREDVRCRQDKPSDS